MYYTNHSFGAEMRSKVDCTKTLIEYLDNAEDSHGHSDREMEAVAGINHGLISKMRKGDCMINNVSSETCWRICNYIGIPLDTIFGNSSSDEREITVYKVRNMPEESYEHLRIVADLLYKESSQQ